MKRGELYGIAFLVLGVLLLAFLFEIGQYLICFVPAAEIISTNSTFTPHLNPLCAFATQIVDFLFASGVIFIIAGLFLLRVQITKQIKSIAREWFIPGS